MSYKKLKDIWAIKEEYRNITGQFGIAPSDVKENYKKSDITRGAQHGKCRTKCSPSAPPWCSQWQEIDKVGCWHPYGRGSQLHGYPTFRTYPGISPKKAIIIDMVQDRTIPETCDDCAPQTVVLWLQPNSNLNTQDVTLTNKGIIKNYGTITANRWGGIIINNGTIINYGSGKINIVGILINYGIIINYGTITVKTLDGDIGEITNNGSIINNSLINNKGGIITNGSLSPTLPPPPFPPPPPPFSAPGADGSLSPTLPQPPFSAPPPPDSNGQLTKGITNNGTINIDDADDDYGDKIEGIFNNWGSVSNNVSAAAAILGNGHVTCKSWSRWFGNCPKSIGTKRVAHTCTCTACPPPGIVLPNNGACCIDNKTCELSQNRVNWTPEGCNGSGNTWCWRASWAPNCPHYSLTRPFPSEPPC